MGWVKGAAGGRLVSAGLAGEVARVTVPRSHTGHCDGRGGTNASYVPPLAFHPLRSSRARDKASRCEDTREENATRRLVGEINTANVRRSELRLIVNEGESIAPARREKRERQ